MSNSPVRLKRTPLDPKPLISMADRVISCSSSDTEFVWRALKRDWRLGRGLMPFEEGKRWNKQEELEPVRKQIIEGYEDCKSDRARNEYVWWHVERRARLPGGYYFVGRYILNYRYLYWPVHGRKFSYAFESILGTRQRVFLLCQRGIYKTVMGGYISPICDLGLRPWELIMISGATTDATEEIVTTIKESIDTNEKLMTLWPHLQPFYPGGKGKALRWRNDALMIAGYYDERFSEFRRPARRESSIFGCAAEQTATRLHPTKWFFDDLINEKNSESQPWLEMVLKFFREVMANVGQGQIPMGGAGTCWTANDLAARLKDQEYPGFNIIHLSYKDKDGNYTLPKAELDKQLTPAERLEPYTGFDDDIIENTIKKTLNDYEFACQYECDPDKRKMKAFSKDNWKTYDSEGPNTPWAYIKGDPDEAYARWVDAMTIFAVLDLAVKTSRKHDWTVIWVLGVDRHGRIWILDGIYDKMKVEYTYASIAQLYAAPHEDEWAMWLPRPMWDGSTPASTGERMTAWRPNFVAIEKGALSVTFQAGVDLRCKIDGIGIDWEEVSIQGTGKNKGKRDRIEKGLGDIWGQNKIVMRKDLVKASLFQPGGTIDITNALRKEFMGHDDDSTDDDGMDALSIGAEWFLWDGEDLPDLPGDEQVAMQRRWNAQILGEGFRLPDEDEQAEFDLEEFDLVPDGDPEFDPFSIDWQPLKG